MHSTLHSRLPRFAGTLGAVAAALALFLTATPAAAQLVEAGRRGSLVFDDLSGFRTSSFGGGGIGYAGPLGVSVQSLNEAVINGNAGDTDTFHYTTFWFAPSVDVFVINHLSIGGSIDVAVTNSSVDAVRVVRGFGATVTTNLPTTTDLAFIPRAGWLFNLGNRWGIWPRAGFGWGEQQSVRDIGNGNTITETVQAFLIDVDCGFLFRPTSDWFLRLAPEFTYGPGNHSQTIGNTQTSANSNLLAFSFAGGFGYMWNR
jgi:hypothetical protein